MARAVLGLAVRGPCVDINSRAIDSWRDVALIYSRAGFRRGRIPMPDRQICYRDIQKYKYRLLEDYHLDTREHDISFSIADDIRTPFIDLTKDGRLTIRKD